MLTKNPVIVLQLIFPSEFNSFLQQHYGMNTKFNVTTTSTSQFWKGWIIEFRRKTALSSIVIHMWVRYSSYWKGHSWGIVQRGFEVLVMYVCVFECGYISSVYNARGTPLWLSALNNTLKKLISERRFLKLSSCSNERPKWRPKISIYVVVNSA